MVDKDIYNTKRAGQMMAPCWKPHAAPPEAMSSGPSAHTGQLPTACNPPPAQLDMHARAHTKLNIKTLHAHKIKSKIL